MKTLKTSAIALTFALLSAASTQAQSTQPKTLATSQTSYYQEPTALGFDDLDLYYQPFQAQEWSETFAVGMYPMSKSSKIRLNVEKKFGETVTIRLINKDGKVLHEKWLGKQTNKFGCYFNFARTEDGTYTIEVANGNEVIRKTINLATPARTLVAKN